VQKKAAVVAPTRAAAPAGPRSNFAEFRRQMKAKQKAAAAVDGAAVTGVAVKSSPRRSASRSPSVQSPGRLLPDSGMLQYCTL